MRYKIVITAMEPNPNFEAELADHRKMSYGGNCQLGFPDREIQRKALETVLDEAEFKMLRNFVLGKFE